MPDTLLSPVEARIVGVLAEKQRTVPDTYPLSLSALTAGCNQKTARDPVMALAEPEVQEALERLRTGSWIMETSGSRVMRYEHNMQRVLQIPSNSVPLLAVLMLRGPQTAAELRANVDRWHRFADTSSVEAYLDELAARPAGALVVRLARAPGAREHRWMHLVCGLPADVVVDTGSRETVGDRSRDGTGEPASARAGGLTAATHSPTATAASTMTPADAQGIAALNERLDMLEYELTERIAALEAELAAIKARP